MVPTKKARILTPLWMHVRGMHPHNPPCPSHLETQGCSGGSFNRKEDGVPIWVWLIRDPERKMPFFLEKRETSDQCYRVPFIFLTYTTTFQSSVFQGSPSSIILNLILHLFLTGTCALASGNLPPVGSNW